MSASNYSSRSRVKLALATGLGLMFVLVAGIWINRQEIADFLIVPDTMITADVAVVLSGGNIPRMLAARDLYKNGAVQKILFIPEPNRSGRATTELERLGITRLQGDELSYRILEASQVPRTDVLALPQAIDGTIHEAAAIQHYLKNLPDVKRIVIVTSKISSRRQCYIFRKVLNDMDVQCVASPYDTASVEQWWVHPRQALFVLMEYQKFIANVMMLAF